MDEPLKTFYRQVQDYDWVEVADRLLAPEALFHRQRGRAAVRMIRRYGQEPFVDIGCGTGLISRHLPPGSVGVDINPRNIERLARHAPHVQGVVAEAEALPFPDGSFRTAVCTEVIEHFPDPGPLIREIHRLLSPGGLLIGSTPRRSPIWRFRWMSFTCRRQEKEPFHREYSRAELSALFVGWEPITLSQSALGSSWSFVIKRI
ncbi:hypothetical protein A3F28_01375 [Candidatus Uhrbacteria bacterium RIFCSPHIGHO2_12_FULL_57_11]|uniref:Methyltransferase type 11 domain-containing protein n=2 Tax=Candidatus Uhriibacteriota TaxID=1752732 RepID=A0A1F7UN72_9BACT|nr:MAG: hypothetical protein A3D72_04410 [Candidatus Uhrbacteria bacterium RIFCSPHIGHO2_02_FULL_57_19]OGL79709.1 MAG: hypothetical protein A3F28_01375 [Candidatus Uhrbacteria bacterium RIFCSPHIGHO2_12_FULL_57_11]